MRTLKTAKIFTMVCCAVATLALSSGCAALLLTGAAAGAGIAGTAYYNGKLKGTVNATPAEIATATAPAFKQLNIQLLSSTSNSLNAEVKGKTAEDTSVTVSAEMKKDGNSEVGIRVGTFGNQDMSEKIYTAISNELAKTKKDVKKEEKK